MEQRVDETGSEVLAVMVEMRGYGHLLLFRAVSSDVRKGLRGKADCYRMVVVKSARWPKAEAVRVWF